MPLSDIEIARQAKMQPIEQVAAKMTISADQQASADAVNCLYPGKKLFDGRHSITPVLPLIKQARSIL